MSEKSIVDKFVNATHIALIPEKTASQKVFECRPISLTTSIYKIFAKLVDKITEPILIANEIADYLRCSKK